MKVLYSFPLRVGVAGIGTTAWHQVNELTRLGVEVTLYCGSCARPIKGLYRLIETMKVGPVPFPYRVVGLDRGMAWHDWRVAKSLSGMDVDVVHCWPSGALRTLQVAKKRGIPSFLERPSSHTAEVYAAAIEAANAVGVPVDRNYYASHNHRRLEREEKEFHLADYLLCPSEAAARSFRNRGFPEDQLRLHQYGYDPNLFFTPAIASANNDGRELRALFAGLCCPLKGLHIALEAWCSSAASQSGTLSICGVFVNGYQPVLERWLAHPSVRVLGYRSDIAEVMRQHDVLIHPSLSEGSALVTYEAQACGLIPLVSDAAGARCIHMKSGLVHRAGDVAMLRDHLDLLVHDVALRQRLRQAVVESLPGLTWAAAARRLAEVYQEACQRQRASRAPV